MAIAVNLALGSAEVIVSVCVRRGAVPEATLKAREFGLTENPCAALTISVTGTLCGAPPDSVTVMVPE